MKKILLFSLVIIIIPTIMTTIMKKEDKNDFIYEENKLIRVKRKNGNVEVIPLEKYIVGVLAGEMPLNFTDEALKAQAIAARTYALKKMENNVNNEYDVVDTVQNQVYLDEEYLKQVWSVNYADNINRLRKIVLETKGEYLTYENNTIEAFYFSTSSGTTENSKEIFGISLPYLQNVKSTWDEISPVYEDIKRYKIIKFCELLEIECSQEININIIKRTTAGTVKEFKINNINYNVSNLVNKLSLRSSNFSISINKDEVLIKTKGYGHGVGMSQYGAQAMSLLGYKYQEILKYYYKNVEIKKI